MADTTSVVKQVEAKYAEVQVFQANFTQTVKSELYGEEVTKGQLTLKQPAMMRWSFVGDQAKEFIADGKTLWIFTPSEKQVIKMDDLSVNGQSAEALLQNLSKLGEMFEVKVVADTDSTKQLELRPKGEGQFKKLELTLGKELEVQSLVLTDNLDAVTELKFTDVTLNKVIDDSIFTFAIPEGVEVISTAGM